jgi:hypothetical protein
MNGGSAITWLDGGSYAGGGAGGSGPFSNFGAGTPGAGGGSYAGFGSGGAGNPGTVNTGGGSGGPEIGGAGGAGGAIQQTDLKIINGVYTIVVGGGASNSGANGGSGIVVIRYPGTSQLASGGAVTISGGYVYHTFTSSGTFTY